MGWAVGGAIGTAAANPAAAVPMPVAITLSPSICIFVYSPAGDRLAAGNHLARISDHRSGAEDSAICSALHRELLSRADIADYSATVNI